MMRTALMLLGIGLFPILAWAQESTKNPHGPIQEPCASCHTADAWKPARISKAFDHAKSGMALTGGHAAAKCTACHTNLDFTGVKSDCVACHRDVHQGTLGIECSRCHSTRSFLDRAEMRRMHQTTRFPLSGAHLATDCESCHIPTAQGALLFSISAANCIDCHLPNYQMAKDPDHVAGNFNRDCTQCHTVVSWAGARFDHNATQFPLTGAHKTIACTQCHANGVYSGQPTTCVACHQTDYNNTNNPAHSAAGFPTTCASCHSTSTWSGAVFDHSMFSMNHQGAGGVCSTCHNNPANFGQSTCSNHHHPASCTFQNQAACGGN
jgi:hypothetical protein